jgi:pre-mRNA-splicing factor ATP-dependent RNA helicase DHX15/PRP43
MQSISDNFVTLLVGETGSGKTTQIPQFVLQMDPGNKCRVVCTQPRRIAAMRVAVRVAEELDVGIGEEVGYCVRFEDKRGPLTRLTFVTEGMLLREMMSDPDLGKYDVILVDEAHERTADCDLLLGLLKQLGTKRPNLRVVVMSATLDTAEFTRFFRTQVITVSGRLFPVTDYFQPTPVRDFVAAAVEKA